MKIIIDDKIPFIRGVWEKYADTVYLPGREITAAAVSDADALVIRTRTGCGSSLLAGSKVRAVATATIGTDHIDGAALDALGVAYSNVPGCNSGSVMQYVIAALMEICPVFAGKTIGVIGVGNVGGKVAAACRALGMNVLLNDPVRAEKESGFVSIPLSEMLPQCDVVTLHTPLEYNGRYATYHMAESNFFAAMKKSAFFINTSRGENVSTADLKDAILTKRIAGAVCDVWENEPEIDTGLLDICRIATSHIAGYSLDGKANGTSGAVRFLAGILGVTELQDFAVSGLPAPAAPEIIIPSGLDWQQEVAFAVKAVYAVAAESTILKNAPQDFEYFRGNYPPRREFTAFTIRSGSRKCREILTGLGFTAG